MDVTFENHSDLVDYLMTLGYDEKTASQYVSLIGDTPVLDDNDNVLVIDRTGKILATIPNYPM